MEAAVGAGHLRAYLLVIGCVPRGGARALGIVGVILFAIIWKAPADGYAKADKLLEQVKADYEAQGK